MEHRSDCSPSWIWDESLARIPKKRSGRSALPSVSIVTPNLNQGRYLESAIRSVLLQDYPSTEYIVMDGGSVDGSLRILQKYSDHVTAWESRQDRGQSAAINQGWRKSSGKYLWWINADDMLTPGSIRTSVRFMEQHPEVDLVYGSMLIIDEVGTVLEHQTFPTFDFEAFAIEYLSLPQPGSLLRKSAVDRIGYLNEDFHYVMDREYWLRLALDGGRIARLPGVLAFQRVHEAAKTQAGSPLGVSERYRCAEFILVHPKVPPAFKRKKAELWSNTIRVCARVYMKFGDYGNALRELATCLQLTPRQIFGLSLWRTALLSLVGLVLGHTRTQALRRWRRRSFEFLIRN